MIASIINANVRIATASPDAAVAYKALSYTIGAISCALQLAALWFAAWYVGWLIALLISIIGLIIGCAFVNAVSEESFEAAGARIGKGINAVRGLFTRKSAVAA